ncbi:hypothetical protein TNCV_4929181 [Trichonephila clavipes]|nr:hypothetical protein TNCV_4929181 [Trichonephila clavipes]
MHNRHKVYWHVIIVHDSVMCGLIIHSPVSGKTVVCEFGDVVVTPYLTLELLTSLPRALSTAITDHHWYQRYESENAVEPLVLPFFQNAPNIIYHQDNFQPSTARISQIFLAKYP